MRSFGEELHRTENTYCRKYETKAKKDNYPIKYSIAPLNRVSARNERLMPGSDQKHYKLPDECRENRRRVCGCQAFAGDYYLKY